MTRSESIRIEIPGKGRFSGHQYSSPNGRYAVVDGYWHDERLKNGLILLQDGTYVCGIVLSNGNRIMCNDTVVSDHGLIALNILPAGSEQLSIFAVLDRTGNRIIWHKIRANIMPTLIAPDGRHALCVSRGTHEVDAEKIYIFDLEQGDLIGKFSPTDPYLEGRPDSVAFVEGRDEIVITYKEETRRLDFRGNLLNAAELLIERRAKASGTMLINEAFDMLVDDDENEGFIDTVPECLELVRIAFSRLVTDDQKSWAHIQLAKHHERFVSLARALSHYETAIALNPKARLKSRIAALRKKVKLMTSESERIPDGPDPVQ